MKVIFKKSNVTSLCQSHRAEWINFNVKIFLSLELGNFSVILSSFYISVFSETIILLCFYILLGDLFLYGV